MERLHTCPHCGFTLSAGQQRCARCGAPVSMYQQPYGAPQQGASPQWLANDAFASGPSGKSRGVAALLAILLGYLGIQYFYMGKNVAGIITIVLSLCSCSLWSIVCLVQGILMFCMDNRTFEQKYINTPSVFPLF